MKLFDFIIVRFTILLTIGIIISDNTEIGFIPTLAISTIVYILFFIVYFFNIKKAKPSMVFGLLTYISIIWFGVILLKIHKESNFEHHYLNQISSWKDKHFMIVKISNKLKSTNYYHRYEADLIEMDNMPLKGKFLVQFPLEEAYNYITSDNRISLYSHIMPIKGVLNPGGFNYKEYLAKSNIHHQLIIKKSDVLSIHKGTPTLMGIASKIRQELIKSLKKSPLGKDELTVSQAILLGQRDEIDSDLYEEYINSGAIHILAVSGLHIGVLVLIIHRLLSPLNIFKNGKYLRASIIILLLWIYAFIAGLSPSICRAVTMFSAITIALNFKRANNIYNTLAVSAFILLLWNPYLLFKVGFQLSYIAVISIVTIQPILYKLIVIKWKFLDKVWQLITVTISAQIGVAPLSLYYFHQFPGLFLVSSLIIIPFLGIILSLGFLVVTLSLIDLSINGIIIIYGELISSINTIVRWIASQEQFIFKGISFSLYEVISSYIIILFLIACFYAKIRQRIFYMLLSILVLQCAVLINSFENKSRSELIIFNITGYSIIGKNQNQELNIYTNMETDLLSQLNIIKDFKVFYNIKNSSIHSLKSAYSYFDKTILVIDSLGIYGPPTFKPDYLILTHSPKINLSRVIDSLKPGVVISDGSNYKSFVNRWKETSRIKKTPFHDTSEKGAFIIKAYR